MAITLEDLAALIERQNTRIDELNKRMDGLSARIDGVRVASHKDAHTALQQEKSEQVRATKTRTPKSAPESNKPNAHVREEEPPGLRSDDKRPEMLAKHIINELLRTRDLSIREALAVAIREELASGQTEVQAHETITNQWRRWVPIADLFPGISTAQFFRASRNCLPQLEQEAPGKRQEALKRQEQETAQAAERKQPRSEQPLQRGERLHHQMKLGIYDPSTAPVVSEEDKQFIREIAGKSERGEPIFQEEWTRFFEVKRSMDKRNCA